MNPDQSHTATLPSRRRKRAVASDLVGQAFGNWVVLSKSEERPRPLWLCRCRCGTEKQVDEYNLIYGKSKSCGCLRSASLASHGHARRHGQRTPTYVAWQSMIRRPGRASIWKPWSDFETFLSDMGERPEGTFLVRVDRTKGFAPENCRWATEPSRGRGRSEPAQQHASLVSSRHQRPKRGGSIPDEIVARAERMLREGHTLQAVARGLGYHRNSLSRRLNQTGYVVPKRGPAVIYRPEDLPIEAIAGALRAGESLLSLSKAHGVNRSVLRRLMRNLGR